MFAPAGMQPVNRHGFNPVLKASPRPKIMLNNSDSDFNRSAATLVSDDNIKKVDDSPSPSTAKVPRWQALIKRKHRRDTTKSKRHVPSWTEVLANRAPGL